MAFTQVATSVSVISSCLKGTESISLSGIGTTSAPTILAGSAIEIAGAWFLADDVVTPNASSWTAITTATTAYLALNPSGTAGSQILSATYESTAVWVGSKGGWYASASSNVRCVYGLYKTNPTSYRNKFRLVKSGDVQEIIIPIGVWNMYSTGGGSGTESNSVPHGLDFTKIRRVSASIINDDGTLYSPLEYAGASGNPAYPAGIIEWNATNISLFAFDTLTYDSTDYNDDTINRGYITIGYNI